MKSFAVGVECANTHDRTKLRFNGNEGRVKKQVVEEIVKTEG